MLSCTLQSVLPKSSGKPDFRAEVLHRLFKRRFCEVGLGQSELLWRHRLATTRFRLRRIGHWGGLVQNSPGWRGAMFCCELSNSDGPASGKHNRGAQPEPGWWHIHLYTYTRIAARFPAAFLGHGRFPFGAETAPDRSRSRRVHAYTHARMLCRLQPQHFNPCLWGNCACASVPVKAQRKKIVRHPMVRYNPLQVNILRLRHGNTQT